MARRPFFSGNYGSALGSTANAANLIAQAGQAQGQMYANLGKIAAESINKYTENKQKKEEEKQAASFIENYLKDKPKMAAQFGIKGSDLVSFEEAVKQGSSAIAKNPKGMETVKGLISMEQQRAQADQTATANAVNIAAKTQGMANDQSKRDSYKGLFQPNAQGQVPAEQIFPQAKQFIQSIQGRNMNPEVAATLAASFQKRSDESGKSAGRTTIVDPTTGKSQVVNLNSKGQPMSVVGEAPTQPKRIRSPEEEEKINITTARNQRGLDFADSIFDQASSSLATKETAKEALGRLDNIETGGLAEAKVGFLKLANSMGLPLSEDTLREIGDTEAFMSATGNFLFDSIEKTKGSISDSEMKIFRSINPGIVQTKEGNRIMLNYFIAKADRNQKLADYVEELEIDDVSPTEIQRKARAWLKDPENDLSNTLEGLKDDKVSESPKNKELINATPSGTKTLSPDLVQLKNGVLEKAKAGQPLTADEQRVLDLVNKQSARK